MSPLYRQRNCSPEKSIHLSNVTQLGSSRATTDLAAMREVLLQDPTASVASGPVPAPAAMLST